MSGLRDNFQPVLAEDAPRSQSNVERRDSGPLKDIIGKAMSINWRNLIILTLASQLNRTVFTSTSVYVSFQPLLWLVADLVQWEDPARTIGSYFAALGFMLAVHHMHLTQLTLKTMAIGLGGTVYSRFSLPMILIIAFSHVRGRVRWSFLRP